MEQLHLPSSEAAHWIGVGTDAGHSTLTWLCMPFPGSLFAVEFSAASGAIRAGVMQVGINDDDDASSDGEEANGSLARLLPPSAELPPWVCRCDLSGHDKAALNRAIKQGDNLIHPDEDEDKGGAHASYQASPQLERVKAYLSSLPS